MGLSWSGDLIPETRGGKQLQGDDSSSGWTCDPLSELHSSQFEHYDWSLPHACGGKPPARGRNDSPRYMSSVMSMFRSVAVAKLI